MRLDAVETVSLQLFGFSEEVNVYVFLKTSMAVDHVVLAQAVVTLSTSNNHQAIAKFRVGHVIPMERDNCGFIKIYPYMRI